MSKHKATGTIRQNRRRKSNLYKGKLSRKERFEWIMLQNLKSMDMYSDVKFSKIR